MSAYTIVVSKSAEKELLKLPTKDVGKIIAAIKTLSQDPRPAGCKKLKGDLNLWRIRIGDYRVLYEIEDVIKLVDVRAVGHRRDIYK